MGIASSLVRKLMRPTYEVLEVKRRLGCCWVAQVAMHSKLSWKRKVDTYIRCDNARWLKASGGDLAPPRLESCLEVILHCEK